VAALALVAAVVLLGILAAILVVVALSNRDRPGGTAAGESPSAATSALPTPSASSSEMATGTPAPTPAPATPTPAPTPGQSGSPPVSLPANLLPPGAVIEIAVEGLHLREEPSTDAPIVATMRAGDAAFVTDHIYVGPVRFDGYEWYRVEYSGGADVWPWNDVAPREYQVGWMAAGTAETRFATLPEVSCPIAPVTLELLALELTAWERLVCLRDSAIVVEGTFGCDGCGGATHGAAPVWLADPTQHSPIADRYESYPFIRIAVPPGTRVPADRDIVRATLRVDHPAAATCTYAPSLDDAEVPTEDYDPVAVRTYCRERLVLDSFEVLGRDTTPGSG
jgi:hypothetical protein